MKIQNINPVNFGKHSVTRKVESGEEDFIFLNQSDKLTVIYDMLCEQKDSLKSLSDRQYDRHNALKSDLKTLSLNQQKMHDFNKHAFDVIAAKIIIDLKKSLSLRLVAAIPFVNQYKRWNNESIDNYFNILAKCDIIVLCNREYTNTCLLDRNKWMVDNSSKVIAVYNGSGIGGTAHCVNYALRMKKKVDVIRP